MAYHPNRSASGPAWLPLLGLILILSGAPLAGQSPDEPAALILRAEFLDRPADQVDTMDTPPPGVGSFLYPDDTRRTLHHHRLVVLRRDGQVDRLEPGDEVSYSADPSEADPLFRLLRALLLPSMETGSAATELDEATSHDPDVLGPAPLRPAGGRTVRSLTPTMVWGGSYEGTGYQIHLWPQDSDMVTLDAGADSTWTLSPEAALSPGGRYEWAVETIPEGQIGPRARFQVASRDVMDEVATHLGRLREMGLDPEEEGILAAAGIFRSMGLPYDALDAIHLLQEGDDPWGPELQDFHSRLVQDLATPGDSHDEDSPFD